MIFQNNLFQVDRSCLRFRRVKTKNSREHLCFLSFFSNGKVQELKNVYLTQVLVWGQKSLFFCCLDAIEKIEAGGPKRNPKSCRLRVLAMFFYVGTLGASNSGGQWFRSHFFSSQKKFGRFLLAMLLLLMLLEKQLALHYKKVLKISETRVIWIMKILRWLISKTNCYDFLGDFLTILTLKYGKKISISNKNCHSYDRDSLRCSRSNSSEFSLEIRNFIIIF